MSVGAEPENPLILLSSFFPVVFIGCLRLFLALYEKDFDGHTAIYWEVKYPFPLSNRDVSFRPRGSTFQV